MAELALACLIAIGLGWASAVIPVINAEAIALAGGAVSSVNDAIFVTLALAIGTTLGKCTLFLGVRTGKNAVARKRAVDAELEAEQLLRGDQHTEVARTATEVSEVAELAEPGDEDAPPPSRWKRFNAWLLDGLSHPVKGPIVIFICASVGIPPLFITASVAGLSQMKIVPFAIAVFIGRWIRFLAIAIPAAMALHH